MTTKQDIAWQHGLLHQYWSASSTCCLCIHERGNAALKDQLAIKVDQRYRERAEARRQLAEAQRARDEWRRLCERLVEQAEWQADRGLDGCMGCGRFQGNHGEDCVVASARSGSSDYVAELNRACELLALNRRALGGMVALAKAAAEKGIAYPEASEAASLAVRYTDAFLAERGGVVPHGDSLVDTPKGRN